MKQFLKGLLVTSILPLVMIGCATSSQKQGPLTSPSAKRIYIPQERISIERPTLLKVTPESFHNWMAIGNNLQEMQEYEHFLARNNVANIIPTYELLRTARDWQKCGRSQYAVPSRDLWDNQLATIRIFKYMVAAKILTDFEVTSVYRDLTLNQCAGGANSSRHLFNSAIDFRIGPELPQSEDYVFIEQSKFKLCQFWSQHGQSLNMGLGLYRSGQIHIDTQGYRTWGPDLTRGSSLCSNYS